MSEIRKVTKDGSGMAPKMGIVTGTVFVITGDWNSSRLRAGKCEEFRIKFGNDCLC